MHGPSDTEFRAQGSVADVEKILIAFVAGGMCWDALTCGLADMSRRTMSIDARDDVAGPAPSVNPNLLCVPTPTCLDCVRVCVLVETWRRMSDASQKRRTSARYWVIREMHQV